MKKFLAVLFSVFLAALLPGCGNRDEASGVEVNNIDTIMSAKVEDRDYKCKVTHAVKGSGTVTITEPEFLEGLTFSWENGEYTLAMKDLSGSFNKEILPKESFALCLMQVLDDSENLSFVSGHNDEKIFSGTCEAGKYKIHADSKGKIRKILVDDKKMQMLFE